MEVNESFIIMVLVEKDIHADDKRHYRAQIAYQILELIAGQPPVFGIR